MYCLCGNKRSFWERKVRVADLGSPFEKLQIDILGPFSISSSGNKYLLVISLFQKWVEAFPIKNFKTKIIAKIFVNQVVSRFGVPQELHTDQDRNFDSQLFLELLHLLRIKRPE